MSDYANFFIEVDCFHGTAKGELVSGDVYLHKLLPNRILLVLSDGAGKGIRANVVANVIASMAMNYTEMGESSIRAAEAIIRTFASSHGTGQLKEATFTIADMHQSGYVKMIEFDNPPYLLVRNGHYFPVEKQEITLNAGKGESRKIYLSEFQAFPEDRLVVLSDGITLSGAGTRKMQQGWGREGVVRLMERMIETDKTVSAHHLSRKIIAKAEMNDLFAFKHDATCLAVYWRQPRKIMVCTGPPYDENKDVILADLINKYEGTKVICGGTTAQIVSRELAREINVNLRRDPAGLPPTSSMEGVDMITEGVLTLSKVKSLLERTKESEIKEQGTDAEVARLLLRHDVIEFVVGTRINPIHQDPDLPVELELRRNLIKEMGRILESRFMKKVEIRFM